jgi:hypothetical protein
MRSLFVVGCMAIQRFQESHAALVDFVIAPLNLLLALFAVAIDGLADLA